MSSMPAGGSGGGPLVRSVSGCAGGVAAALEGHPGAGAGFSGGNAQHEAADSAEQGGAQARVPALSGRQRCQLIARWPRRCFAQFPPYAGSRALTPLAQAQMWLVALRQAPGQHCHPPCSTLRACWQWAAICNQPCVRRDTVSRPVGACRIQCALQWCHGSANSSANLQAPCT
jgi:hypothetical protein